jgi:hypothetical protein
VDAAPRYNNTGLTIIISFWFLDASNGTELSRPAEDGNSSPLYGTLADQASLNQGTVRRDSFRVLLGGH